MNDENKFGGVFLLECFDKNGKLKWADEVHNLTVNEGLQHILDVTFAGGTQVNPWYIGLTDGSPTPSAADTMSSHGGWSEVVAYSEATREEYVDVRSGQSVTNSASPASFSINGSATVGGAFLSSNSVKSGTSGTLLAVAALTGGNRSAADGDTINVTYNFSGAAS
jgi:hypothetical protein